MKIALLHPSGLVGDDLRILLNNQRQLWQELRLLTTDDEEAGTLTELADGAAMVTKFEEGNLDDVDVACFCGDIEKSRPLIQQLPATATAIILSRDASPEDGHPLVAGVNLDSLQTSHEHIGGAFLSPHPATVLLASILHPLRDFRPERATATIIQPVSVYSRKGLEEVFEQTRGILHFAPTPPRDVFPTQMAFNIVPNSFSAEHVGPHLKTVLASSPGAENVEAAIQVLQSGVFHSYGASIHLRLAEDPGPEEIRERLGEHPFIDLAPDPELLGMIDAAAREEVLVGHVEPDPAGGCWIWAVMDNLTCGGALNALRILDAVRGGTVN